VQQPSSAPARDSLVITPTYNESETLEALVNRVLQAGPFDMLIVDDHSPDGTGALAEQLAAENSGRVKVLHRDGKRGLGTAYVYGFRWALDHGYEHVFQMDADFSHDPATLPVLRARLDDADVVLGSRYVPGGQTHDWPIWRRALSQGGSLYASLVLGLPFRDLTGGFKGFRSHALAAVDLDSVHSNGYAFQIEMTYLLRASGCRIVEQPIVFEDRRAGRSKMHPRIVVEALFVVWRLRFTPPHVHAVVGASH
jgi:dolichol-phosphate mannosyltransferase